MAIVRSTVYLKAKYVYLRCDGDMTLKFTNGSSMSLWGGFYRFLSSDLKRYNTNDEFYVEYDSDNSLWVLTDDTFIESVNELPLTGGGGSSVDYTQLITDFKDANHSDLNVVNRGLRNLRDFAFYTSTTASGSQVTYNIENYYNSGYDTIIYVLRNNSSSNDSEMVFRRNSSLSAVAEVLYYSDGMKWADDELIYIPRFLSSNLSSVTLKVPPFSTGIVKITYYRSY